MGEIISKLTVFFEDPFWVGVFERYEDKKLSVAKFTFGAEPKDFDVYKLVSNHYYDLRFSPAVKTVRKETKKNPKRMMRYVRNEMQKTGIGTKSQQALKLQQEQNKLERKTKTKEQKLMEATKLYELRKQKKKEKHKGH